MRQTVVVIAMSTLLFGFGTNAAGAGSGPTASRGSHLFPAQPLETWATQRFVITNRGAVATVLLQRNITNYATYSVDPTDDTCFTVEPLGPGRSCHFDVVFHPVAEGVRDGAVTLVFDSGPVRISLVGVGSAVFQARQFGSITAGGRHVAAVVSTGLQRAAVLVPNDAV